MTFRLINYGRREGGQRERPAGAGSRLGVKLDKVFQGRVREHSRSVRRGVEIVCTEDVQGKGGEAGGHEGAQEA